MNQLVCQKNNQDKDLIDNKLTNLVGVTVNRGPSSDNELSITKYIDAELAKNTFLRFNQTQGNYLKVSIGNGVYNLVKYKIIQITDTRKIKAPNTGGYLQQNWVIKCNDKINNGKTQNFLNSTKTKSPTRDSGTKSLPPIGDSFMYIETSSNINGEIVVVSLEGLILYKFLSKIFFIIDFQF